MSATILENMQIPNQEIEIFSGELKLVNQDEGIKDIVATGSVFFRWFPNKCVLFSARIVGVGLRFDPNDLSAPDQYKINIPNSKQVSVFITRIVHPYPSENKVSTDAWIEGICQEPFVQGDSQIKSMKYRFSIPNVYPYGPVKLETSTLGYYQSLELVSDETIEIIFDDHKSPRPESLFKMGGYLILATGIISTKKYLNIDQARSITDRLSSFLSFLEGRKVSTFFLQAVVDDEVMWTDYTVRDAHPFQAVTNWPNESLSDLQQLWISFCKKWVQDSDRDFLLRGLKWYVLANSYTSDPENSIIISQTALELIFNKFFIETEVLLDSDDIAKLSAANKIRLVLDRIDVSAAIPEGLRELQSLKSSAFKSAVEIVVNVRNSLVHSKVNSGKQLRQYSQSQKSEAARLLLYYIELALLHYLNYTGTYNNRTVRTRQMEVEGEAVPWIDSAK